MGGGGGGREESLVARSVLASSLLSPRFIRGLWIQELLSCGELLLFFLSRLALPPDLCMLDEVVRRVRFPSVTPVRVPPWPPDLRLRRPGGYVSPLLVGWLSCAVWLDRLVCCFPLCGRGVIVGGLRTANGFTAFALVVSVWPVAVF